MTKTEILYESSRSARVLKLSKDEKQLSTPSYFPAVSAAKLSFPIDHLIDLLIAIPYPRILVSAYDICTMDAKKRKKIMSDIANYSRHGSFVFLDSGVFESFWRGDGKWSYGAYKKWVFKIESDFYFSFDALPDANESQKEFLKSSFKQIETSRSASRTSECVPILHGLGPKQVISIVRTFVSSYPQIGGMIAVTERDCGRSLSERACTILELRQILNEHSKETSLHILGCGNPISIALYSYCGADTFDSLDWAKFAVERDELRIVDLAHHELLKCRCRICSRDFDDPIRKVFLHNLLFYQDFVLKVQAMIRRNTLYDFVLQYAGPEFMDKLRTTSTVGHDSGAT